MIKPPVFSKCRVLVVGDIMLDAYLWGDANRISPEAPVPVVKINRKTYVLGGAGNVAANMAGLEWQVTLIGAVGRDWQSGMIQEMATNLRIDFRPITARSTISKTRIMAQNQQVVRVDEDGELGPYMYNYQKYLSDRFDVVVVADYCKGFMCGSSEALISTILQKRTVPVFIDTKSTDWAIYSGATCITPNIAEFRAIRNGLSPQEVMASYGMANMIVTQGNRGLTLYHKGGQEEIPASAREVYDVSGAGDTVIAVAAAAYACGVDMADAARLANTAAGAVVGKTGTSPITLDELRAAVSDTPKQVTAQAAAAMSATWKSRGETVVFTNGCFDLLHPGHIELLRGAAKEGRRLVVGINSDESVRRLKGPSRPVLSENDRCAMLSALDFIDAVVVYEEDTPIDLVAAIVPTVIAKGGDYAPDTVVGRDVVEQAGGRCVILPVSGGVSTSKIIERIRETPDDP